MTSDSTRIDSGIEKLLGGGESRDLEDRDRSRFLQDRRWCGLWTYMNAADVLARRPLIAAVTGLLLVSACSSAAESTPTPIPSIPPIDSAVETTPASTQTPPATTPPTTTPPATAPPPADPSPIDAVDVSGRTVFGVSLYETVDVDAVARDVSARLGSPTADLGWQSSAGQAGCPGSTDFRVLWWGDFRMTFERYEGDGTVVTQLAAWTVGDPTLQGLAPIGDIPTLSSSNVVTVEGIGLGSTLAEVEAAWDNVHNGGENRRVIIHRGGSLSVGLDDADQVIAFGGGPFDCPVDEVR